MGLDPVDCLFTYDIDVYPPYSDDPSHAIAHSTDRYEGFSGKCQFMSDNSPGRSHFNDVSHIKVLSNVRNPSKFEHVWTINGRDSIKVETKLNVLPMSLVKLIQQPDVSKEVNKFVEQSSVYFHEQFHEAVSGANFLIELKDFRKLAEEALSLLKAKSHTISVQLKEIVKDHAKQGVGGNYLEYKFNFAPLEKDVKGMLTGVSDALDRLEFLLKHTTYREDKNWHFKIERPDPRLGNTIRWDPIPALVQYGYTYYILVRPVWSDVSIHAEVEVSHNYALKGMHWWWAVADTYGLNNSIKIAWNATKLSWLVDFFIDSKKFINAFHVNPYSGELSINSGLYTVKQTTRYEVIVVHSSDNGLEEDLIGAVDMSSYFRKTHLFGTDDIPYFRWSEGLEDGQKLILAALGDSQAGITDGRSFESIFRKWRAHKRA